MNTLIESINKVSKIKNDLNQVLRDNGLEGGKVFEEYPEKFRELFRVMSGITGSTVNGYTPTTATVITEVPAPDLSQWQNVVYVTNNLEEATIYYYVVTDSGKNNIGITALEKGETIIVSEPSTVYVYAQYRAEKSSVVNIYVPWQAEVVPNPPVITRNGTTITITADTGDSIYYAIDNGSYQLYSGAISDVARTSDVYAFSQNYRGRSDIVMDEAPEQLTPPEVPTITCSLNNVSMACTTTGATIWYKTTTNNIFVQYTGNFNITRSAFYIAKSYKDGLWSDESDAVYCEYLPTPEVPAFNVTNNVVYLSCPTNGASIYYKIGSGSYQLYSAPITLTETVTITAYSTRRGMTSDTVSQECVYVEPVIPTAPETPVITCSNNIITITCLTDGATIWYKTEDGNWVVYTGPFEITESDTYYTYSSKDGLNSEVSDGVYCEYIEPVTPEIPAVPVFACINNIVSLTCSTLNAVIYYRNVNDQNWSRYDGGFEIFETGTYVAYAEKNGQVSATTSPFTATYDHVIVIPNNPEITCFSNVVTITCSTPGATIYYSINNGEFFVYSGDILINSDILVKAYAEIGGITSGTVSRLCMYIPESEIEYLYIEALTTGRFRFQYSDTSPVDSGKNAKTIYISYDKKNWYSITGTTFGGTIDMTVNAGQTLYIKGNNTTYANVNDNHIDDWFGGNAGNFGVCWFHTIGFTGRYNLGGNIMSLIYGDDFQGKYTLSGRCALLGMFQGYINAAGTDMEYHLRDCSNVVLPATTLSEACYVGLFADQRAITSVPELPATTLAKNCYLQMYKWCYALITPPELPVTTLEIGCYRGMFFYCKKLATAPELLALTLVERCYEDMFYGCELIDEIKCIATSISAEKCTKYWLSGVSSSGVFIKDSGTTWTSGNSGIPDGWTVQNA